MKTFDIDRAAPASGAAIVTVNAPVECVWRRLAGIGDWPLWNPAISHVRIAGPISVGTEFRWRAGGIPIRSQIERFDPMRSIGWTGHAPMIHARHICLVSEIGATTRVVAEESFTGPLARMFPSWCATMITSSLEQGFADLKLDCEHEMAWTATKANRAA